MLRKLSNVALVFCFLIAGHLVFGQDTDTKVTEVVNSGFTIIKVADFADKAPDMVGKQVQIEGMVTHVCRHSGTKLFIISGSPDINVKITTSDKISVFDTELEGNNIRVTGIVETIAAAPREDKKSGDAVHENIYDKPQYSISCQTIEVVKE
jgi:hypothetical protein